MVKVIGWSLREKEHPMPPEVIALLVLAVVFLIATVRSINMGALALVAAAIVGVTVYGVKVSTVVGGFPGGLFVILVGVTYLFAIAKNNGTVEWIVHSSVRAVRGRVALVPWVMFAVCALVTAIGAVSPAAVAIVAPVAMGFAARYGIHPVMMGLMVVQGATAGSFSPMGIFGAITNGVVESNKLPGNRLLLFLLTSVAITVMPGPDNLQVIARGVSQGRRAGLAAAAGFASGCLFHTTLAALGLFAVLVDQAYDLGPLQPGTRQILGRSILATGCYGPWLGGIWQSHDDLRVFYDSSVETIAFGTFPWGLAAPMALAWLLARGGAQRRLGAALCLAWAAAAWIATEAFARKVGFTLYAGFPALALAVALWLDAALEQQRGDPDRGAGADHASPTTQTQTQTQALLFPSLLALFFVLAALTLGKDLQTFPDRLASLLVGDDAVKYPAAARWLWIPPRVWVLLLGLCIALATAVWLWRGPARLAHAAARPGSRPLAVALAATAALAAFWAQVWHPELSRLLSSKGVFATYHALRRPGDRLVVQGNLGNAPRYYARGPHQSVTSREEVLAALAAPTRTFVLAPASELCFLHRTAKAGSMVVLDNDNPRTLLLSNRAQGASDRNPLLRSLFPGEPPGIRQRPTSRIVFDDRIELLGWNVPAELPSSQPFEVTLYYKILAPVGGTWRVFQHYDRPGGRFLGDHVPIAGRCPTSDWQAGDYIADRHVVDPGAGAAGTYELWTGFFTGSAPSWQNMPVTQAPADARDPEHRVKVATVKIR